MQFLLRERVTTAAAPMRRTAALGHIELFSNRPYIAFTCREIHIHLSLVLRDDRSISCATEPFRWVKRHTVMMGADWSRRQEQLDVCFRRIPPGGAAPALVGSPPFAPHIGTKGGVLGDIAARRPCSSEPA